MYMLQEILRVDPSRLQEAHDRLAWIHGLMSKHTGFVRASVSKAPGNETDHLILRAWNSEDAFRTFRATDDGQGYSRNRPAGLYEGLPVGRAWELVGESGGDGGVYLMRCIGGVAEARRDAFIGGLKQLRLDGDASLQVWRCLDESPEHAGSFLALVRTSDEQALKDALDALPDFDTLTSSDAWSLVHESLP